MWGFYGRQRETENLQNILGRGRWFFARITGRRRIGKTALVQKALAGLSATVPVFYVQIPDSAPAGVLSAVADAMETFSIDPVRFPRPRSLLEFSRTIKALAEAGFVVALDEFQYFNRRHLYEFTSHLQSVVDDMASRADAVPGGLLVLGSLHTELVALLDDRAAPLYNRTTDHIELDHLDIASVTAILRAHSDDSAERLLFLWNLFEGVPKFYRDCFEQDVLAADRHTVLSRMFFRSSSPLRTEADNWFLHELRGRYDVVLKYVARHPGCSNADIVAHIQNTSPDTVEQVGGYLKLLIEKYRMIERRQPIFSRSNARRGRYHISDNFLRSWLAALHNPVAAINFRPESVLVQQADERLREAEGAGFERLVSQLYEERGRRGVGDFNLTQQIDGYWDRADVELDLVAVDDEHRILRIGSCKRSADKLARSLETTELHIARFLEAQARFRDWTIEKVGLAPTLESEHRRVLNDRGWISQDVDDLLEGLRA